MSLAGARLLTIWIASLVSTLALMAADYPVIPLSRLLPFNHLRPSFYVPDQSMPHAVDSIVGAYGSVPFVILTNLFLLAVIVFYARDVWHPTADVRLSAHELQARTAS